MIGKRASWALVFCLWTGPAMANDFVNDIVNELQSQGYDSVVVEYTMLGRVQIHATRTDLSREVVVNPHTGEILRDLRTRSATASKSDDNDDEDDGDDRGDDDGGHGDDGDRDKGHGGGGNSGSGGGGSGGGSGSGGDD